MKKRIATVLAVLIVVITIIVWSSIYSYNTNPDNYSEEKHIQRVTKRVQKYYITDGKQDFLEEGDEITGFDVYPLYDEFDELAFFVVDFEPYGFVYVQINSDTILLPACGGHRSMYSTDSRSKPSEKWSHYTVAESEKAYITEKDKCYEIDENGEVIYYNRSHFNVAGIKNERRYLLRIKQGSFYHIPAVKRGDKYLNLVSMEEMDFKDGISPKKQAIAYNSFRSNPMFDLY